MHFNKKLTRLYTLLLFILFAGVGTLNAQEKTDTATIAKKTGNLNINGKVFDAETQETVQQVAIQIYSLPDSTYVTGVTTDKDGIFSIQKMNEGHYLARFSFLGYTTADKNFTLKKGIRQNDLGNILIYPGAIELAEAVIEAELPETQVVDDTLMYNTDAFHVKEGALLEDLLKRMPGVDYDQSDGSLYVNGKRVSRILVEGEEFFGNDMSVAIKNLPAKMIKKIKTYQKKSDMAEMSGIDDGEEETVMDLSVKADMRVGWINNLDVAAGYPLDDNDYTDVLKYLYNARLNVMRFQHDNNYTLTGNAQNSIRGGVSQNASGGFNFNQKIGEPIRRRTYPLSINGNVRANTSKTSSASESYSETFTSQFTNNTFSNSRSGNRNNNRSINADINLEWNIDTLRMLRFRPNFSLSESNNSSSSESVTLNQSPDEMGWTDVLAQYRDSLALHPEYGVNSNKRGSMGHNQNYNVGGQLTYTRRFEKRGRNLTLQTNFTIQRGNNKNYSHSNIVYYQSSSDTIMNRLNSQPSINDNVSARVAWTEPIDSVWNASLTYQIQYRNNDSKRKTYTLPSHGDKYQEWSDGWYEPSYQELESLYLDDSLSNFSHYQYLEQNIQLQFSRNGAKGNLNIGATLRPQHTTMIQDYLGKHQDIVRNVLDWSPTFRYRYRFTRQRSLQANFSGNTGQPSIDQLRDITDNSNPLNISMGNPNLLPTFSNTLNIEFQDFKEANQRTLNANASWGNTLRRITNRTVYDETTGVTVTQPINMKGFWSNWNARANLTYNIQIQKIHLRINSQTQYSFNHSSSYLRSRGTSVNESVLSATNTSNMTERLRLTYSHKWLFLTVNGQIQYNPSRNNQQPDRNMDVYTFNYGIDGNCDFDWHNLNIATDITMRSRRGYDNAANNTDELIWNASASMSFFRENAGTLMVEVFDILRQQDEVNRNVSNIGRSDTRSLNVHRYFMVHFTLNVNIWGNKEARRQMRLEKENPGQQQPGRGQMMGQGGRPMGGGAPMGGGGGPRMGGMGAQRR
ncbi:MAG: TonB-dependent receptor [Bacteroidaceae bacterium]|nr:TonB-dependent receptor [Bacteroidaceae bacterium]